MLTYSDHWKEREERKLKREVDERKRVELDCEMWAELARGLMVRELARSIEKRNRDIEDDCQ